MVFLSNFPEMAKIIFFLLRIFETVSAKQIVRRESSSAYPHRSDDDKMIDRDVTRLSHPQPTPTMTAPTLLVYNSRFLKNKHFFVSHVRRGNKSYQATFDTPHG